MSSFDSIRTIFRPARKQSIFRTERAGPSAVPRVFGGLVVCFAVAGLLSSQRLVDMADRKEFGPERDRWLAAADTIHGVAAGIGLDRPASAIDAVLGRGDDPSEVVLGELAPTGARGTTVAAPPVTRPAEDDSAADDSGLPSTSTSTTETPEAVTATPVTSTRAVPTPSTSVAILGAASSVDPLRIWIGGDSLGEYVGSELLYRVAEPDLTDVELDFAISTGLVRPDYFDWPARLSEVMQRDDRPQVVIFMVGGNDDQDMLVDGERVVVGTDEWREAYRRRAATMMDISAYSDLQMLWINLPPMREERREAIAIDINTALAAEADLRPWVEVVDIVELFRGPDGGYEQFLADPAGDSTRKARANDGVHITRAASRWVADMAWARVLGRWRFDRQVSAPTTTMAPSPEISTTSPPVSSQQGN